MNHTIRQQKMFDSIKQLFGSIICRIKGTHRWMRRKGKAGDHFGHVSVCDRCGAVRAIKHRNKEATK